MSEPRVSDERARWPNMDELMSECQARISQDKAFVHDSDQLAALGMLLSEVVRLRAAMPACWYSEQTVAALTKERRALRAELAAMRPVVEAAVAWRKHPGSGNPDSPVAHTAWTDETRALMRSVDNLPPEMRPKGGSDA